jgi:hypothetical protein
MSRDARTADAVTTYPTQDGVNPSGSAATPLIVTVGGFDAAMAATIAAAIVAATVTVRFRERYASPAPGATIHALVASGAAVSVASAFTQMIPATNARISRSGAGNPTVYTVTGTRFGVAQTETINSNGASDVEGVKVFDTITAWSSDVDPGVSSTLKTGVIIGLAQVCTAIDFFGVAATAAANAVAEAATLNAAKDGFTPTTAPDGTKVFDIRYKAVIHPAAA